ncbi:hypothetical protein BVC80_8551g14 [Macleaya cordata]|uniref:Uncharacterized protein n=1 Tax=Macleaya cordata TaxID=56857 RepID=A0A200QVB3_MACCD|nr:hypothetical protein BVC80_8551g14 [Macleaya cordata]
MEKKGEKEARHYPRSSSVSFFQQRRKSEEKKKEEENCCSTLPPCSPPASINWWFHWGCEIGIFPIQSVFKKLGISPFIQLRQASHVVVVEGVEVALPAL